MALLITSGRGEVLVNIPLEMAATGLAHLMRLTLPHTTITRAAAAVAAVVFVSTASMLGKTGVRLG